jgi:hypothetical protein
LPTWSAAITAVVRRQRDLSLVMVI